MNEPKPDRLLTEKERMNVDIPCESCDFSRNMGHMNIGNVECLDCAVKYHIKAQDAKTASIKDAELREYEQELRRYFEDKITEAKTFVRAECQAKIREIFEEIEELQKFFTKNKSGEMVGSVLYEALKARILEGK